MNKKQVQKLFKLWLEDEETPARVMEWAALNQGKPIHKDNVPSGFEVRRQFGMTHLDMNTPGVSRHSYLVSHKTTGAKVPTPEALRDLACPHYGGREQRNEFRRKIISTPSEQALLADAVTCVYKASTEYREALEHLEFLTAHPCPGTDRSHLHNAAGVIS